MQWIEVEGFNITLYKDFPQQFEVIKEVNKYNHYFTPRWKDWRIQIQDL